MCIAIYKPADQTITKATLAECFNSNSDGAGFMYVEDKKLHMQKGFFKFEEFYEAYKPHENKQAVIHFRIKTHGPVAVENCHPFHINKGLGFVHNGIISGFGSALHSDTRDFNEKIIQPLVAKWGNLAIFQPAIKSLVEARIGYSKLIFLDRHGNVDIFNENKGVWDSGVWYSNTSYKPYVATYTPPPKSKWSGITDNYDDYTPRGRALAPVKVKDDVPKLYSRKLLPLTTSPFRVLEIGALVELTRGHWDEGTNHLYLTSEVFEVIAVNQDWTADLAIEDQDGKDNYVYGVPFSKLDFHSTEIEKVDYSEQIELLVEGIPD